MFKSHNSTNKKLSADLVITPPTLSHTTQNPKSNDNSIIHQGQDLNLAFPSTTTTTSDFRKISELVQQNNNNNSSNNSMSASSSPLLSPILFSLSPFKASPLESSKTSHQVHHSPHNQQPPPWHHLKRPLHCTFRALSDKYDDVPMVRLPPRRRLLPNTTPRMLHQKRRRPHQPPPLPLWKTHLLHYGEHWRVRGRRTESGRGGGGGGKGGGFEVAARKTVPETAPLRPAPPR